MHLNLTELLTVAEDLEYLRDSWGEGLSDAEIRRGSALLRRLVVEKIYSIAWRSVGLEKQPSVVAVNLEALLSGQDLTRVETAFAGGGRHGGIRGGGMRMHKGETIESLIAKKNYNQPPMEHKFSLSQYTESFCAVVDGDPVRRRELIQYFAHTRGGVHLRATTKKDRKLFKRVDKLEKRVSHSHRDGLFFELQSMAQDIGKSEDAQLFIKTVRSTNVQT